MNTIYSVPGMSCQNCAGKITAVVGRVPGVRAVVVDLAAKTVTVDAQDTDDQLLRGAIDGAGYKVA